MVLSPRAAFEQLVILGACGAAAQSSCLARQATSPLAVANAPLFDNCSAPTTQNADHFAALRWEMCQAVSSASPFVGVLESDCEQPWCTDSIGQVWRGLATGTQSCSRLTCCCALHHRMDAVYIAARASHKNGQDLAFATCLNESAAVAANASAAAAAANVAPNASASLAAAAAAQSACNASAYAVVFTTPVPLQGWGPVSHVWRAACNASRVPSFLRYVVVGTGLCMNAVSRAVAVAQWLLLPLTRMALSPPM